MDDINNIDGIVKKLSELILNSDEYIRYIDAKNRLEEDLELKARVDAYRKWVFETKNGNKPDNMDYHINDVYASFSDVQNNIISKNFLNAELILCRKLQDINKQIVEPLELSADFI